MTAPAGAVRTDQAAALLSDEDDLPESEGFELSLLLSDEPLLLSDEPLLLSDELLLLSELEEDDDSLCSLASRARRLVP
jgi:hypothetical protein